MFETFFHDWNCLLLFFFFGAKKYVIVLFLNLNNFYSKVMFIYNQLIKLNVILF